MKFRGTLQCDAYSGYRAYARNCAGRITLAGCWAHARRKFHETREQSPRQAGWLLRRIGHLYRIEAGLRDLPAGPRLREAARASENRPIHLTNWQIKDITPEAWAKSHTHEALRAAA